MKPAWSTLQDPVSDSESKTIKQRKKLKCKNLKNKEEEWKRTEGEMVVRKWLAKESKEDQEGEGHV